jgi:leucyl/phenylalanyl-tRNA---protein transferase
VRPTILHPTRVSRFPDPSSFDDEGLVAVGGNLSVERLLLAYENGLFPWYNDSYPPLWWCPNPRAVLPLDALHISRSMSRTLRQKAFRVSWNEAFDQVIRQCSSKRQEGTWILPEVIEAYETLHERGHAHSVEVWHGDHLVGGLYGVQRGGLFAAESMFHRATDMSKVALLVCAHSLRSAGIGLFDVQFLTPHLESLGAHEISRQAYLNQISEQRSRHVDLANLVLIIPTCTGVAPQT